MGAPSKRVFVRDATGLVKQITTLDALGMSLTGMGMLFGFDVIAFTAGFYPGANPLVTQFAGFLISLPIALVYILMAIAIPRAGGDYVWVGRVLHPAVGFVNNFGITLILLSFLGVVSPEGVYYGLAEWAWAFGKVYNDQGYLNLANYFLSQSGALLISVIIILICGLIAIASVSLAKYSIRVIMFLSLIIGAVFVVVVLGAGPSTFEANFNALSGSSYQSVITAGVQAGAYNGVPTIFSGVSFLAGVIGVLSYLDFWFPAYFAGEVKGKARRSQVIAQLGGLLIFATFTTIITAVSYWGEGPAFANALSLLWATGSSANPYPTLPLASGLSLFWTTNPFLISLFNFGWIITIFGVDIAVLFTISRNLFAWSFDRILPSAMASVNDRTHTPIVATAFMILGGLIYCYIDIYNYGILQALFSYATAGVFIAFIVVAIAAIVFPWRRRDLFDKADSLTRMKVVGVPIISIFGVLAIIASGVVIYAVILPIIGVAFLPIFFTGIIPTFIIGIVIYLIAWAIRRKEGISLELLKKELPPE
jgi:amino acid transporter